MNEIPIKDYLHQIWRRRRIVALFFVGIVVFVSLFTMRQSRIYRASTTIEIGSETPDVAFFQDVVNTSPYGWWSALRYYETQYQIIESRALLEKVAERGMKDPGLAKMGITGLTAHLQGGLSVEGSDNSRLAEIRFDDTDPDRAQALSILVAEIYVDENLGRKLRGVEDAVNWLNARLGEIREEKAKQEKELSQYKEDFRVVSLADGENVAKANLAALTGTLNKIKSRRIELKAQYDKLSALVKRSEGTDDLLGVVNNNLLEKLKQDLADLKTRKSQLTHRYGEKHPTMIRLHAEMAEVEKSIRLEVENEVSRLKTRFLLTQAEERSMAEALEKQKIEAIRLEEVNQKLADIQVLTNMNQEVYTTLQKKLKEADLSALIRSNNVRIVDRALRPSHPIRPNVKTNLLLAILVGFLGGIALALLLEYMDDTLKNQDDVETYLKLPVLASVPHLETKEDGNDSELHLEFAPYDMPSSSVAEAYRTLRTNALFLTKAQNKKLLLVVSTGPGEGKTVTALNLGVTMAQIGLRTIVVDLDFRRPKLHHCFSFSGQPGVTNVLLGEATLDGAIKKSQVPNLDYIAAGVIPPNPAEMLGSEDLKSLLLELTQRYDQVIVDSSPIAPVTDATIVAQIAHGVMLVVRSGKTVRKAVMFAREQLETVNADILGVVLNDLHLDRSNYRHYDYYKYGYRYGSDVPGDDKPRETQVST